MTTDLEQAFERYRAQTFFGSLNGIRFLCIFMVLWHHSPLAPLYWDVNSIFARGFVGVDFFFVLSGFLITTLLLREERRTGRISLTGFYRRRLLRIVPVYFLVVTLVSAYYVLLQGRTELAPLVPYYYLFLSNFLTEDIPLLTITWSLAVEEQYYMLWPLMLIVLPKLVQFRAWLLIGLIGLCLAFATGALDFLGLRALETEYAVWALPMGSYGAILLGSLTALLLDNRNGFAWAYRIIGHRLSPLVAFALVLVILTSLAGPVKGWIAFFLHISMAGCIASVVIRERHVLQKVLAWRPIARVGEISYGIYLYHLIALHFGMQAAEALPFTSPQTEAWAVMGIYAVLAVIISEISFRTYERFFLTLKDRKPAETHPAE